MKWGAAWFLGLTLLTAACTRNDLEPDAAAEASTGLVAALQASDQADPDAWSQANGIVAFVAPRFKSGVSDAVAAAELYFATFAVEYEMADASNRLAVVDVTETAAGTVVRFGQTLDGLSVFAGEVTVAVDGSGRVDRVTGVVAPDAQLADPVLSADEALAAARTAVAGSRLSQPPPRLVAFSPAVDSVTVGDPKPAWEVELVVDDQVPIRELVLIDAVNGSMLLRAPLDRAAEDWDLYDAENALDDDGKATFAEAELIFETRDSLIQTFGDGDEVALAARDHLGVAWSYFFTVHGRDGHDGAGGQCRLYVHMGVDWKNASGSPDCTLRFGDGRRYAEGLDVVAHEFTHAVSAQIVLLVYEGSSGALDEHYSDFFATMVDTSDWDVSAPSYVLRSMDNPRINHASEYLVTDDDDGGVHSNSGIANYAGYLVAHRFQRTHPDSGIIVQGIGRAKAEQIWYATLFSLTPRTGLEPWACATISTARDMTDGLLTEDDLQSVIDAMVAVGLVRVVDNDVTNCDLLTGTSDERPTTSTTGSITTTSTTGPATSSTSILPSDSTSSSIAEEQCDLVGTWRLRDEEYVDQLATLGGGSIESIEYVSGDYTMDLNADGTYSGHRMAWTLRMSSPDGVIVFEITSDDPGTWTADEETISISESGSQSQVRIWVEEDGELTLLPLDPSLFPTFSEPIDGTGTYQCLGDVLEVMIDSEVGPLPATFDRLN